MVKLMGQNYIIRVVMGANIDSKHAYFTFRSTLLGSSTFKIGHVSDYITEIREINKTTKQYFSLSSEDILEIFDEYIAELELKRILKKEILRHNLHIIKHKT
jgi:hypothetical protein